MTPILQYYLVGIVTNLYRLKSLKIAKKSRLQEKKLKITSKTHYNIDHKTPKNYFQNTI